MLEEERKYEVAAGFTVPDLAECAPAGGRLIIRPATKLRATYYDTLDLRLARSGASLRHRRGDDEPWTVKLPTRAPGVRNEISAPGSASTVPARLLELVTSYTRGAPVAPVTTLNTVRQAYQLCDADDRVAVEVVDDTVSVTEGKKTIAKFREIEVERKSGRAKLLDRVEARLRAAGVSSDEGGFTPKYVRALGLPARTAPDWPATPGPLPADPTAAEVMAFTVRRCVARIVSHDPLVRLRVPAGDEDTAVRQMLVGCRRLRCDLATFASLVDRAWARALTVDLDWLTDGLGVARDAEVLRARLRRTAAADSLAPLDEVAVARIDADLAARYEDAMQSLDKIMCDGRYHQFLDRLLEASVRPRITGAAAARAAKHVLPALAAKPLRLLAGGGRGSVGAGELDPLSADEAWHEVRAHAKRARYAAEAVELVVAAEKAGLAGALRDVQEMLDEHLYAAVAAQTWLAIANADPDDHALAFTAGRLYERERLTVRAVRAGFPLVWGLTEKYQPSTGS